jgi:hypothetical protein
MRLGTTGPLLLLAALGCTEPQRAAGSQQTLSDLVASSGAGTPDGKASVVLRSQPITYLSNPYVAGTQTQEPVSDGLVVQPAFTDQLNAAFVTSEIWDGFPRVWSQPLYILVSGFDPVSGPILAKDSQGNPSLFIFGVSPSSRFYSPFWRTFYVTVPAGYDLGKLRSANDVVASGLTLTPGPLRLATIGPNAIEVAHPQGQPPVHPFTGDVLTPHLAQQGLSEGNLIFFVDFGNDRFRITDANSVVSEVALFRLALAGPDGAPVDLGLPPIIGTGPFRAPRPAPDAPNGFPRFGALRHEFLALISPQALGTTPGIFISQSRPELRAAVIARLGPSGAKMVPVPSIAAEQLPQREQFTLRVALDATCISQTDFPDGCTWLDTQAAVENNLPAEAFTDTLRFSAGGVVLFDGVAP